MKTQESHLQKRKLQKEIRTSRPRQKDKHGPPLLELEHVMKLYMLGDEQIAALNDVSIILREGEFVAIMGPSGSGKSTLLHVASFLDSPSKGNIRLHGKEVTSFDEKSLAKLRNREIGFIFQQFHLLERVTAIENVELPLLYSGVSARERRERAISALQMVGLGDRLRNKKSQLSGGQQQRVAIARALVTDPSLIFADEPTGNLDSKSSEEIMQILATLHEKGKTIIMVTHEHDVAQCAERIIRMRDGRIFDDGI